MRDASTASVKQKGVDFKVKLIKTLKKFLLIFLGNTLLVFGIASFLEPTGIISAGTAGVGLLVQTYFHLPISTTLAVVNIACFLLGFFVLGWKFAATTLLSTLIAPVILRFFEGIPALATLTDDLFLAAVFAGVLAGVGVGLVMREGASTGGLDIPPLILQNMTGVSVGTIMLMMNCVILALQIPHSNSEQILYGIINALLTSLTLDKVLMAGSQQAQLLIFSPHYEQVRELLIHSDVGLTLLPIETGFTQNASKAILCALPSRKLPKIKARIAEIDETSFVLISSVAEVRGRGFTIPR